MTINMQEWATQIINGKERKNLPILFFPCLKNINIGVIESVQDSKKMAETMAEVIKEYPETIAAITGMDLTIDSEAFGSVVKFSKRQAPSIKQALLQNANEIDSLKIPDVNAGRQNIVFEAIELTKNNDVIGNRPVFGGMLGPFSLAANLFEVSEALKMCAREPKKIKELIDKTTDFLIQRAKKFKKCGANGIFIAEPTAGLLSPDALDGFSSKYIKKIAEAVQDEEIFLILHNCGNVKNSVQSMCETGCKGLHFGNSVKMTEVLTHIPKDILVFGNIDPSTDFVLGTPESIYKKTMKLLEDTKQYPNFVLSTGCDLAPMVSNENIMAYYSACRDYNKNV